MRNPRLFETRPHGHDPSKPQITTDVTLRDLFAAFTMAGIHASSCAVDVEMAAAEAYRQADEMLVARKGKEPT